MNRTLSLLTSALALSVMLTLPGTGRANETDAEATSSATLPAQPLTPETLYTFLLAEIAGARGEVGVALDAYLDLAKRTRDPRIARRATEIALFARNLAAATEAARIWTETDPTSDDARRVLANTLTTGERHLDEVQIQFARILANTPDHLDQNLMGLTRALSPLPDKQKVRSIVFRLTEPYLDRPEAQFARAQAAALSGDGAADAMTAVDEALRLRPDWEPAVLLKSHLLLQTGAIDESTSLLDHYLLRHPESRHARLAHARALVTARQFEAARSQFNTLLRSAPDDRDLMYAVALLSSQVDDLDTAVSLFEKALAAGHPEADNIRLNLGQIAERRQDPDGALRWYRAVEPGRHHLDAQVRIATVMARQGKLDEARGHLHGLGGDEQTRKQLLLAETQLLRDAGRENEAFDLVEAALAKAPEDHELLYESSMLAERLGRLQLMETRLRKLIALRPDHAHAYNALGYSLADRGLRLDEAEQMIARALELSPNDPFILDSMGWVRFRRGAIDDALAHLQRAYALRPDPEIAAHLGEVLWALKRHDDAGRVWDEALQAHPDNTALKSTVQRLRKP